MREGGMWEGGMREGGGLHGAAFVDESRPQTGGGSGVSSAQSSHPLRRTGHESCSAHWRSCA